MRKPDETHVVVLMGGWSPEREVSLVSGAACADGLRRAGFQVSAVDAQRNISQVLADLNPDVAFNALHGTWGEDGTVQGILETMEIPYTHSGVLASALAMDKERSRILFQAAGLPVADGLVVSMDRLRNGHPMPPPYVIKPVAQGSSVGVHIVEVGSNGPPLSVLEDREIFGDSVLVERFIPGRELTCAIMGGVALAVTDIVAAYEFYDYRAKYGEGGSKHILPADIPRHIYRDVQRIALETHTALGCRGISRVDFRYDETAEDDGLIVLEVNTQPGMTGTSLVPEQAAYAGHGFDELVSWMVQDASCRR